MATHLLTRSRLFDPDSVAVFGASPHSESLGHRLLRNLRDGGFHGRLVGIHPRGGEAAGIPLQARLEDSVDLALVCVPRDAVPAVLDQCRAAGVRAAAILTSGFAECDAAGALLQQEVRRHAADGMAIVGPNGLGVFNGAGRQGRLVGTFLELAAETRPGVVSLLSQSGGCAALLFDEARRRGLGIAKMASLGNMAGLGFRDLLGYLAQDDATKVIGVFAEDLRDLPPCPKPTVLLIGGRSAAGRQAAMRHTGSGGWEGGALPPDYLLAEDSQAFFDALEVLSRCARPRGRRVAIVGNSGGMLVLAADACAARGLEVAAFSTGLRRALQPLLPAYGQAANPLDLTAQFRGNGARRLARLLRESGEVDAVICSVVSCDYPAVARWLAAEGLPVVGHAVDAPLTRRAMRAANIPLLASVERCARALALLAPRKAG